jgi:hypothetical protein
VFLNRRCALVLVLESILLILVVKIVLQHIPLETGHRSARLVRQKSAKGGSGAWLVTNRWHDQRWVHQTAPARRRSKRPYLLLFAQEILCHQHLVVVATVLLESIFLQAVVQKAQARIQSPRLLIVLHHGELDEFDALAS